MTDHEQRTDEWHAARLGRVTASRLGDVLAKPTTAAYRSYRAQLIAERLTGEAAETFTNAAMQWGVDTEDEARRAYSFIADRDVVETGFVDHPAIPMTGASPDGLVGDEGLVEIKCPKTATHIETITDGQVPLKYLRQMQWQMACTGREWCDFVSYDPRLPPHVRLWIKRVERDDTMIANLADAVTAFLADVDQIIAALTNTREKAA